MANSLKIIEGGDLSGLSPTEIRASFVSVEKELYDALLLLVVSGAQARKRGDLPAELDIALRRVETVSESLSR